MSFKKEEKNKEFTVFIMCLLSCSKPVHGLTNIALYYSHLNYYIKVLLHIFSRVQFHDFFSVFAYKREFFIISSSTFDDRIFVFCFVFRVRSGRLNILLHLFWEAWFFFFFFLNYTITCYFGFQPELFLVTCQNHF